MFIITAFFVDGTSLTFNDHGAHETLTDVMATMKKSIRQGMFLQVDNRLIDLGKVTYIEVNETPVMIEEDAVCLPEQLELPVSTSI
mgnify:CR=1 FL=1